MRKKLDIGGNFKPKTREGWFQPSDYFQNDLTLPKKNKQKSFVDFEDAELQEMVSKKPKLKIDTSNLAEGFQKTFNTYAAFLAGQMETPINQNKIKPSEDLTFNNNPYGAYLTPDQGIGQTAISKYGKTIPKHPDGASVKDNTYVKPSIDKTLISKPKSKKLNTEEYYTNKRNQKLISGALNTGSAVAPPGMSSAFDVASISYGIYNEEGINPLDLLKNNKKILSNTGLKQSYKTVPGIGRFVSAYQAGQDFYDAKLYNDSINLVKNKKFNNGGTLQNEMIIENNNYKPISPTTFETTGPSHKDGGSLLQNGNNLVEIEGTEPFIQEPNGTAHIFGAKKILNLDGTRGKQTYKSIARNIGKEENKLDKQFNKIENRIVDNPTSQFDSISNNTSEIMLKSTNKKLNSLRDKQLELAELQEIDNTLFPSPKARNGKTIPKAPDGITSIYEPKYANLTGSANNITKNLDAMSNPSNYDYEIDPRIAPYYEAYKSETSKNPKGGKATLAFQQKIAELYPEQVLASLQKHGNTNFGKSKKLSIDNVLSGLDGLDGVRTREWINFAINPKKKPFTEPNTPYSFKLPNLDSQLTGFNNLEKMSFNAKSNLKSDDTPLLQVPPFTSKKPFEKYKYNSKNDVSEIASFLYNPDVVVKNRLSPIFTDSPNISLQNERNRRRSTLNSLIQANSDNPQAQAYLAANALQDEQGINEKEFNINQSLQDQNRKENANELKRIQAYNNETDYENTQNTAIRRFNKFAVNRGALSSMALKRLQHDKNQNDLKAFYDNMINQYSPNKDFQLEYMGNENASLDGLTPIQRKEVTDYFYNKQGQKVRQEKSSPKKKEKYGASITKMMKNLN